MKFLVTWLNKALGRTGPKKPLCWRGHDKEYLALRNTTVRVRCISSGCCSKFFHDDPAIEARWSCRRCGELGFDTLMRGAWKIEFGQLLPDPKAWANWEGLSGQKHDA
jgi:hypothetical protein